MSGNDEILNEFIAESREHLADIETDLLTIEASGADIDEQLVNKVFRAAHSMKGGSGFFGLNRIKELAHKAETVLDMIRGRKMVPNPEITNILLAAFDKLREMINDTATSESVDISEHAESLNQLASSYSTGALKASIGKTETLPVGNSGSAISVSASDLERARQANRFVYQVEYDMIHDVERKGKNINQIFKDLYAAGELFDSTLDIAAVGTLDDPAFNQLPIYLIYATVLDPDMVSGLIDIAPEKIKLLFDPRKAPVKIPVAIHASAVVNESLSALAAIDLPDIKEPEPPAQKSTTPPADVKKTQTGTAPATASAGSSDNTLRVSVTLLESLMNLAGELVLSRNQLREALAHKDARATAISAQRINLVTSDLQDAIMQTRMQPIGNVFSKFPRVVRDIARLTGKEIELDIRGKDVGLDKSLIEGLSEPLMHMVRNAADHGVESAQDRVAAGKKSVGQIRLEARHEAGQVVVEISDDGKGIDPARISASALKKGLITQEKYAAMNDKDKIALIFLPGLSTAEKVTDVSGRGVGMDVVKTNIDQLGGKVEIDSVVGQGSTFRIKLPLTLAIIPSLIVTVEDERYAIPQISVVELLHIRAEDVKKRIEIVGSSEVLRLRDQIIPVVRFSEVLSVVPTYLDPKTGLREIDRRAMLADRRSLRSAILSEEAPSASRQAEIDRIAEKRKTNGRRVMAASDMEIVVVTTGTLQYGLVVSAFRNTEEIVVKPLGRHCKGLSEYAGATIMGDGAVVLIVDVSGLGAKAQLHSVAGSARASQISEEAEAKRLEEMHSLLLFHNYPDEVFATPLSIVRRVEKITAKQVESAGGRRTMQYRGTSLPLVALSDAAQVKPLPEDAEFAVIVTTVAGREVGLLGAMPVDVVETAAAIDQTTHRQKGIVGSTILNEKTVLLTDIHELVNTVYPEWSNARAQSLAEFTNNSATEAVPDSGTSPAGAGSGARVILLAEDSDFFRAQVKRYLEEEGFAVLDGADGEFAWELLDKNAASVCALVTDIEMPRLSGLGLAQRVRADGRFDKLPIIGVTSLAGDDDVARGKAAGINEYQIKLDRDKLMDALRRVLAG